MTTLKEANITEDFARRTKAFLKILQQAEQQRNSHASASTMTKDTKSSPPLPKPKNDC